MMRLLSARFNAWIKSPTCSICNHRLARSMIRSSRREPIMRPYAESTALRWDSSSLPKIQARSRAGSLTCISCQLVTAVIAEPENRKSPSEKPPCTMHVENDHNPSVSMIRAQLLVISCGTCPAERRRLIQAVSCERIWPVVNTGYLAAERNAVGRR